MRILGHIVDKTDKIPDPSLITAITKFDRPESLMDIHMLIGLAEQANKYIPDLADILKPIRNLREKGVIRLVASKNVRKKHYGRSNEF